MKCVKCGCELNEGAIFCGNCGTPVENSQRQTPPNQRQTPPNQGQTPPNQRRTTQDQRRQTSGKSSGKKGLIAVIAVVWVLIIVVAVIFGINFLKSRQESAETKAVQDVQETFPSEEADPEDPVELGELENEGENETADDETDNVEAPEAPAVSGNAVVSVDATTSLKDGHTGALHKAQNAYDNDLTTAWVEGVGGQGINESITFNFDGAYQVSGININAGYQKTEDLYYKNSRPEQISIEFSDGTSIPYFLDDVMETQILRFSEPVITDKVTIKIQGVYPGTKYEDTAISEISFF